MRTEEWLEKTSELARAEPAPPVDVCDAVSARLRLPSAKGCGPLAVLAGLSGAAAAIVLAYALDAWSAWQDPITDMFLSTVMVLQ